MSFTRFALQCRNYRAADPAMQEARTAKCPFDIKMEKKDIVFVLRKIWHNRNGIGYNDETTLKAQLYNTLDAHTKNIW